MPSSQTSASPYRSRTAPLSKSLIARIRAPFSSNQRNPLDQEIHLDEPFRQHSSGDTVKGAVLLNTTKALRITHLVIRLHGFVKVVNNARLPGETIPYDENLLTSTRRRRGIEYFGNGFARLFEDERVLCGDGRLSGRYEFRFELDIPSKDVPSSIDFEHGTISYLLTSTLTRPTTISPTLTVHHKLNVTGTIDIAQIQPPKPRIVSVEAVSQKPRPRIQVRRKSALLTNGKASIPASLEAEPGNGMSSPSPQGSDIPPLSPVPSVGSSSPSTGESTTSTCNQFRAIHSQEADGSVENLSSALSPAKTITVRTEILHGGCLPGDPLPIRVSIDHMKPIKTMQGLIITIFRQARIDTHPALPIGTTENGGRRQYEDYYPRSRTGLGGLSLSSAGSSRVFRQDLAQTITPLIIDPQTLNANIKTSIQMPDHAFPSITCVPGEMISFKYFVEIIVDLRGRVAGQDRFLPSLSITHGPQYSYGEPKISKVDGIDGVSYSATPGFNYLITDQIRRTKGVIFTTTEVIVGTRDSARSRLKQRENSHDSDQNGAVEASRSDGDHQSASMPIPTAETEVPVHEHQLTGQDTPANTSGACQPPLFQLPPDSDEPQDEKSQIRRAEERLLPSSPPQDEETSAAPVAPVAPFARDEEDFMNRYGFGALAPAYDGALEPLQNSARLSSPPQPPHRILPASRERTPGPCDDKQEVELQRLQERRSAPEDDENGGLQVEPSAAPAQPTGPSAPALREDSSSAVPTSPSVVCAPHEDQRNPDHSSLLAHAANSPGEHSQAQNDMPSPPIPQQTSYQAPCAPSLDEVELALTNDDHGNEQPPVYRR